MYSLQIKSEDGSGKIDVAQLDVRLDDYNDNPHSFTVDSVTIRVSEDSSANSHIGNISPVMDLDIAGQPTHYIYDIIDGKILKQK